MRSINFFPENYDDNITCGKRQGTVLLGDKSKKYCEDDIIWITVGKPNTGRRKIFTAVIERIYLKTISLLTLEDLRRENLYIDDINQMQQFLSKTYNTPPRKIW